VFLKQYLYITVVTKQDKFSLYQKHSFDCIQMTMLGVFPSCRIEAVLKLIAWSRESMLDY
jgi:hypothetical protein